MTRQEYLERLRQALAGHLAAEELERTMAYYTRCLEEAGAVGEEALMDTWGEPEELAGELLANLGHHRPGKKTRRWIWAGLAGVLILSAAFWVVRLRPWAPQAGSSGSSSLTESFDQVEVDLEWGTVTLRQEEDLYRCEADWTGTDYTINAWVEQGVLHVEGKQRGGLHLDWKENQSATVTITVPEGAALRELSVYTSLGDVTLTGGKAGLETGPLTVESDLGSVTVESLSTGESDLTLELGDLTVTGCTFQNTQIENSSGAVTVTDSQVGDLTCTLDLGDLTLERVSGKSADWTADLGSLMVQEGTFSGGTVTCDGGEVALSGALSGTWTVNNSLGGIAFSTTVGDWGYDLTTDLGTIWVDEANQGTRAQPHSPAAAAPVARW